MNKKSSYAIACVILCILSFASAMSGQSSPTLSTGQTRTLLPNGNWLLLGGTGVTGEMQATASLQDATSGAVRLLPTKLRFPRAWHTATVLPNGDVLVLGGIGSDTRVVNTPEVLHTDSMTFGSLTVPAPMPRAFHTATLLTDGRVFIAGGASASGRVLDTIEVWDPRQKTADVLYAALSHPRRNHQSTLLADGRVLISGGQDGKNTPVQGSDVFDPDAGKVSQVADTVDLLASGADSSDVRGSSPDDNAATVALDAIISVRFSRLIDATTATSATITLEGPTGSVESKVVTAEGGMLAFVNPNGPLSPDSLYKVTVSGVSTSAPQATVPFWQFTFTTIGIAGDDEDWIPNSSDWITGRGPSPWQSLPPLQAGPGVTALAGQVLKLNGQPLINVTLNIGNNKTHTDSTGRFLLAGIDVGHQVMLVNGHTADRGTKEYGVYEIGVDLESKKTTALRYTIWMTALDRTHAVHIPSPTTVETVITNPLIPNLEFRIPAGTIIKDHDGNPVHEVSITPVPIDRPPFPLPHGVVVPVYFTIQPGAGYVEVKNNWGPKGGRLIYPNSFRQRPGATLDFYDYTADNTTGWYVYGQGRVSGDGKQVVPNPGVVVYELTGAMVSSSGFGPSSGPHPGNPKGGDPVDLGSGLFVYSHTDLVVKDVMPIVLTRTYRQNDYLSRAFGVGTSHPYDMFLTGNSCYTPAPGCYTYADLYLSDGTDIHFQRISSGYSYTDAVFQNTTAPGPFYNSTFKWNGTGWTMTLKDGTLLGFPDSENATGPQQAGVTGIQDRFGNHLIINRNLSNGQISQITTQNGRWVQFTYDSQNRITQAQDNIGRAVLYGYDPSSGMLTQVTDANGGVTKYTYDPYNDMSAIEDPRGIDYITVQYGLDGFVQKQILADGGTYQYAYTLNTTAPYGIAETDLTDPVGNVRKLTFNVNGYNQTDVRAFGKPEQQTTTYNFDPVTNLLQSVVDAQGRTTSYTYDTASNIQSVTLMSGTAAAATTSFAYDPNFNQLSSLTDPLLNKTTLQVDSTGLARSITDPLQHTTTYTYNASGQVQTATDALQHSTSFCYDSGDVVSQTDPLNNTTTAFYDSVGRIVAITNALNQTTHFQYDNLDNISQIIDPRQGVTALVHDPNENLLSYTDANHHTTNFAYDNMDRVVTKTDPLGRSDTYQFDLASRLVGQTDRRGKVSTFRYDGLNRRIFSGFGTGPGPSYESYVNLSYDNADRLIGMTTESPVKNVTRTYDDIHRSMSETTSLGTVTHGFDAAGRPVSLAVSGQQAVSYTYDVADRLYQVTQGAATVLLGYDDANRRTSLTLPNGVVVQYGYDNGSNLTSLSYSLGSTSLGTLNYVVDGARRRVQVSGTFARVNLPQPVASIMYDSSNAITQWGSTPFAYDPSGNLISDGTTAYSWDARNQVASVNGASVTYDAFGRRIQNAAGTQFLYDGPTAVQELANNIPTANRLTSINGFDEFFTRTDASGSISPLGDALGSTIALTDQTGGLQTQYTYEPFGKTAASGSTSTNSYQFTGRENDGGGVYFYRARYYEPGIGRFISEDPIGFAGGANSYSYTENDPIDYFDPFGLDKHNNRFDCANAAATNASIGGNSVSDANQVASNVLDWANDPTVNGADDLVGNAVVNQSKDYIKDKAAGYAGQGVGDFAAQLANDDAGRELAAGRLGARIASKVLLVKDAADIAIWLAAYYYSCNIDW